VQRPIINATDANEENLEEKIALKKDLSDLEVYFFFTYLIT
jgi:hypothetical protein